MAKKNNDINEAASVQASEQTKSLIRTAIASYKEHFDSTREKEKYKWIAIKWYKDHVKLDAENFEEMLAESFKKAINLLASSMYYPYAFICDFAKAYPKQARNAFNTLIKNDEIPFEQRYYQFRDAASECFDNFKRQGLYLDKHKQHYQDVRAVMVYLTFEYPEKYYLFKSTMYTKFRNRVRFKEDKTKKNISFRKLDNFLRLCELVREEVVKDNELLSMHKKSLTDDCYKDTAYHLLTMDVIYYGAEYMSDDDFKTVTIVSNNSIDSKAENPPLTDVELNTILYGPPGTGKTYHAVIYAVAIIENRELASVEAEDYPTVFARYQQYKEQGRVEFTTFHQSYGYEEFIEGIKPTLTDKQAITYHVESGVFKRFCERAEKATALQGAGDTVTPTQITQENYVFIIDEINRGNISKIFGELITLIEPTKRVGASESMTATLPYSQERFGVPKNVYIIGTMNTADRSIASIDTALRRRFSFCEMLPNPDILDGIIVEDLSISEMMTRMNRRIEVLYDREHTIGHAYFLPLMNDPTVEMLAKIFKNNIIPLLQEYFYEDYEKIRMVLGDNRKVEMNEQFIVPDPDDYAELFGDAESELDDISSYKININAFENIEAYRSI